MCGRFALETTADYIKSKYRIEMLSEITPRFNIAPSQKVLVIMNTEEGIRAEHFQWGLVPFFAKDKVISPPLINARSETVAEKPAFRHALKSRRCLVIMSGFFEWLRIEDLKQPYYITMNNNDLLAVAGLWEQWQSKEGEVVYSCCMLTTEANNFMSSLYHRMPVILNKEQQALWLEHKELDKKTLSHLVSPYQGDDLQLYPVTAQMNNWRFTERRAIERLP
ncbi:SOS response-associated peptidase [Legionella longbeachae]|uniref:SOS response-associated peptidase n=1 Tax=Legionella longbeachae TaxID=450 RepID=UPI001404E039|nr:SOS response-associated peptidase [Legionella longbeachae]QIN32763.1 SOS response-associated peptidase [Legionella longbeachae]